jgi:hypothetical protein
MVSTMLARCFVVIAALVAFAGPARADTPPRVGVVVQLAVNVDSDRADAIGAALADALDRELVVDAVGGADASRALPTGGVPDECLGRADCIQDIARRLDAAQLLFLVLVQVGDDVQVDASWVDVASETVLARPRVTLSSTDEAQTVSVFSAQAAKYLPDAKPRKTETIIVNGGGGNEAKGIPSHMTTTSWIFAGGAVVAAGAGTILGLGVRSTYNRCHAGPGCSPDEIDGMSLRAHLADASFAVAAGAAITSAILYLRSGSPAPEIAPAPGGGAVVGIAGRW